MLVVPYAKYAETAGKVPNMEDYAKKSDIPAEVDLSNYATKSELPNMEEYAKKSDYYSKAEIDALLATLESKIGEGGGSGEQGNSGNGVSNGMEYVDLGLSVKWATCNI